MTDDDELPEANDKGIWYRWLCPWYRWLCPNCENINESEEDTRGMVVTCDLCGKHARHVG